MSCICRCLLSSFSLSEQECHPIWAVALYLFIVAKTQVPTYKNSCNHVNAQTKGHRETEEQKKSQCLVTEPHKWWWQVSIISLQGGHCEMRYKNQGAACIIFFSDDSCRCKSCVLLQRPDFLWTFQNFLVSHLQSWPWEYWSGVNV